MNSFPTPQDRKPQSAVSKETRRVQGMFGRIAPVYDLLNHLLSLNIDRIWRRFAARQALRPSDRHVLDLACGTGDLLLELQRQAPLGCRIVGADFCLPMLEIASRKKNNLALFQADGLRLPFNSASFDLVTIAFGLRNMEDTQAGLREMRRVLKPGGRLAILEFTLPQNRIIRTAYLAYFQRILPAIGNLVSGSGAYGYLSQSVAEWPEPRALAQMMKQCGFRRIRYARLSFGIAALHLAERD